MPRLRDAELGNFSVVVTLGRRDARRLTVLIRVVQSSGEASTVGRLELDRGRVVIDADPTTDAFLRRYRCVRPGHPDLPLLSIADGEPWLRALPFNLRGTHLWAEAPATRT